MIPPIQECLSLLIKHQVPDHIIQHSKIVRRLALYLGVELNKKGERLDLPQIEAGALLHDIAKIKENDHSQAGAELLIRLGYPEIAEIVRQHVILDERKNIDSFTEAEIVHYADKRVKHTTIVSLTERFKDLRNRYGKTPSALAWLNKLEEKTKRLEKRIFAKIEGDPQSLPSVIHRFPVEEGSISPSEANPR